MGEGDGSSTVRGCAAGKSLTCRSARRSRITGGKEMDPLLFEAAQLGNVQAMRDLVQANPEILGQVVSSRHNTALHVAARAGQSEFVSELLRIRPHMCGAVNRWLDTALHEAAREGRSEVVHILLQHDLHLAYKVNRHYETALFTASSEGHLPVVQQLLRAVPSLISLDSEKPDERTSLHAAAFGGHVDIVKELVRARPGLVRKADGQGWTPMHSAASQGHLEIIRELLSADPDICYARDDAGRSPLHVAAMKGRISVLHKILLCRLDCAQILSTAGESILHSAVENNQYEVVEHLIDVLDTSELINKPDNNGNTVLHLATRKKLSQMVRLLASTPNVNVNVVNREGMTALDIVEREASHSGALMIGAALQAAEAKRGYEIPPEYSQSEELKRNVSTIQRDVQSQMFQTAETGHRIHRIAKELRELHKEGIKNAASTITVVAVLIATVTFATIFTVPGGTNDDGTAKAVKTVAFKVFLISDTVGLFASLGIVLLLVTVVPFHRKKLKRMLFFTNKVMWLAIGCTASTFIAAAHVAVRSESKPLLASVYVLGGGSTAFVLGALTLLVANHQRRKAKLRTRKKTARRRNRSIRSGASPAMGTEKDEEVGRLSNTRFNSPSDSDLESSERDGYHVI